MAFLVESRAWISILRQASQSSGFSGAGMIFRSSGLLTFSTGWTSLQRTVIRMMIPVKRKILNPGLLMLLNLNTLLNDSLLYSALVNYTPVS